MSAAPRPAPSSPPALRPPVGYYGAKVRLARRIVELLPEHRVFVETHAGSAAVLFAKPPSAVEVLNDLDGEVAHFFHTLRTRGAELARVCQLTPYSRAEYEACADRPTDLDPVEQARRWWWRCGQSFDKAGAGGRAGWASSAAPRSNPGPDFAARADELPAAAARLRTVLIENRPAVEVITKYGLPDAVLYVDPPYLDTTRAGRERSRGRDYRLDTDDDDDAHRALAAALHATPGTVLLSGYPSPLYDELYLGWHRLDVVMHRPSGNHSPNRTRHATETIWSNRPFPTSLPAPGRRGNDGHGAGNPALTLFDTASVRDETPASRTRCDETPAVLVVGPDMIGPDVVVCGCGAVVVQPATGRPRAYCSRACQQRAYRARRSPLPSRRAPVRVRVVGDLFHGTVPEGAVYVGRAAPGLSASRYANPHKVGPCRCGQHHDQDGAVTAYRDHLTHHPELLDAARAELARHDLACWCRIGPGAPPCHADVLLQLLQAAHGEQDGRGRV